MADFFTVFCANVWYHSLGYLDICGVFRAGFEGSVYNLSFVS